ncbi:hypothetical protein RND81_03G142900 [Saponaria officinalis]|uniref:DUF4042 domain-containing protein n=2 Tax=Saponaria officinalis TaxID=3572 RepID=A0AAW1M0F3_SAPOF
MIRMAGVVESVMANTATLVRSWRTAFLTLRDETSSHQIGTLASVLPLLDELLFAQFHSFVAAAGSLPPHEVTSDMMYLLKLAASSCSGSEDMKRALSLICHLVHNIALRVSLELSSSAWSDMLESFSKLTKFFIEDAGKTQVSENSVAIKATMDCLESTRHLISLEPRRSSISENSMLVEFLLHTVICCHSELNGYGPSRGDVRWSSAPRKRYVHQISLWKVQTTAFSMIDEAFSRVGSSLPIEIWQSVVEVLRKVMDALATKTSIVDDGALSRFYTSLLRCLHIVLINRKGSISDHLAAFIAALKMFLGYGLNNSSLLPCRSDRDPAPSSHKFIPTETGKKVVGAYRPPHLRRRKTSLEQPFTQTSSDHDSSPVEFSSSDSDYSDSDGALKENMHSCKARVAAITCIQDLCEADPKAFVAQWTMLLPTNDALQPRKYEATLMTCFLYDPFLKVRLASASTIAAMLEGPSPAALQLAEYRESSKCGSFMALSSSLGQILMQLHAGVLYLIEHEKNSGLLTSSFKILMLLISSTPYSRMPAELLPRIISSLRLKIEEGFPHKNDQSSFMVIAISCLTAAVSTTPSSMHINRILQAEISTGLFGGKGGSGLLNTLFHYAEKVTNPTICLEALQALKTLCHNYPSTLALCWKQISTLVYKFLRTDTFGFPSLKGAVGHDVASTVDKVVSGAVKVLDECLRAISGFKGTEDLFGDRLMESPFALECVRDKKISSAPLYGSDGAGVSINNLSGTTEWSEALEEHIAISIHHASGIVRAASITCFAGITCSVFSSLEIRQQRFILCACTDGANDLNPSVRSAACRAIGVIACFPEILRSAEILHKFINAVEVNTHDQPVSVRITASWAMANICDAFSHCVPVSSLDMEANFRLLKSLLECSLQLARDGDKIKSNAVRALGNLSRVIPFNSSLKLESCDARCLGTSKEYASAREHRSNFGCMHLLERIVQTFLSCITTGNVKVQWNVCHALSNLFLNESLRTQPTDWASPIFSILLLLLRDSSNFKIRIQAAAALAVPLTVSDYGSSFSDIVRGIEYILENATSDQNSTPNFKYRMALEKQLTASMLHVLGLCSSSSDEPLKEFLVKKAPFFERWLNDLCSSLSTSEVDGVESFQNQKRVLLSKAMQSLIDVFESKNHFLSAQKLQKLLSVCG